MPTPVAPLLASSKTTSSEPYNPGKLITVEQKCFILTIQHAASDFSCLSLSLSHTYHPIQYLPLLHPTSPSLERCHLNVLQPLKSFRGPPRLKTLVLQISKFLLHYPIFLRRPVSRFKLRIKKLLLQMPPQLIRLSYGANFGIGTTLSIELCLQATRRNITLACMSAAFYTLMANVSLDT
jgi:hypothetical protein